MVDMTEIRTHLSQFEAPSRHLSQDGKEAPLAPLLPEQSQAETRWKDVGLPTRRDEYWKYTDPGVFLNFSPQTTEFKRENSPLFDGDVINIAAAAEGFVVKDGLATEIKIDNLSDDKMANSQAIRQIYGKLESQAQDMIPRGLAALNTHQASRGMVIECPENSQATVQLLMTDERKVSTGSMIHHVIDARAGAQLTLAEIGTQASQTNIVYEIRVGEGASVHLIRAARLSEAKSAHMCSIFADVAAGGAFNSFALSAWSPWSRQEYVVRLKEDEAKTSLSGAVLGREDCHHDDMVLVIHEGQNCQSRQVFKKVLRHNAKGIFQGKILVRQDAQKTDGYQISQGLLLDDESEFCAKPELEIYADDVVCSHGSTSGGVDETQMFYLRSRGIAENEAQELLSMAFLSDAIEEVADEQVRVRLDEWAKEWFVEARSCQP